MAWQTGGPGGWVRRPTMGYDDDPADEDNLVKLSPMTKDEANILWNVLTTQRAKLADAEAYLATRGLSTLAMNARAELATLLKMMLEIRPIYTPETVAQPDYSSAPYADPRPGGTDTITGMYREEATRVTQEMLANEPGVSIGGVGVEPEDTSDVELHGGGGNYRDIQQQPLVLDDEAAERVAEILVRRGRATMPNDVDQTTREVTQGWLHDHRVSPQQAPESEFEDITGLVDDLIGETVTDEVDDVTLDDLDDTGSFLTPLVREADPELERLLAEEEEIERQTRSQRLRVQRTGYELYWQAGGRLSYQEWHGQRFSGAVDTQPEPDLEEETEVEDHQTDNTPNSEEWRAYHVYLNNRRGYMLSAPMTYDQWVDGGRPE